MANGPQIEPTDDRLVFLTDGTQFLGPYVVGDPAINRGTRQLREVDGAREVHAIRAHTEETARAAWRTMQQHLKPAPAKKATPAKKAPAKKAGGGKRA